MLIMLLLLGPPLLTGMALLCRSLAVTGLDFHHASRFHQALHFISIGLILAAIMSLVVEAVSYPAAAVMTLVILVPGFAAYIYSAIQSRAGRRRANQAEFLWVLATAVNGERPLAQEIEAYAEGQPPQRRRQFSIMADRIRSGMPLTELLVHPGLLPQPVVMEMTAGIRNSNLQQVLGDAVTRMTRELADERSNRSIGFGLSYPPALLVLIMLQVSFILYYIIPKFKKIFDDFGTELPPITKVLINLSSVMWTYWPILALPILVYFPLLMLLVTLAAEYYGWPDFLKRYFGNWFIRLHTPEVLRTMSLSISSNQPVEQTLQTLASSTRSSRLRRGLYTAIDHHLGGVDCWQSLGDARLLNVNEISMLQNAQRTGNLPWAAASLADQIESRRIFRLTMMLEVIKPTFLLFIAFIAAFVCCALFMPLIKLLIDLS